MPEALDGTEEDSIWHKVFIGHDGLPAVWGLLIFFGIAFVTWVLAGSMLISMRIVRDAERAASGKPLTIFSLLMNDGIPLFAVTLAAWIMSKFERRPVRSYGFGGTSRAVNLLAGFGWGIFFLSLLVGGLLRAGLLLFDGRALSGRDAAKNALVWMFGFLLVALFEEYAMRGYLQFTLARGLCSLYESLFDTVHGEALGFWTSAIILSFFFGYWHGGNPGESTIGLWSAGLIGLVFCFALWKTGSLWWALGFHAAWDWAQSFVFGVADSGTMVQGHLYASHPVGKVLLSGGATGPEGSVFVFPVLIGATLVAVWTLPKREWPVERAGVVSRQKAQG